MNQKEEKHISKFLSLVLRHKPEEIQLELDDSGWADIDELIAKCAKRNIRFSKDDLMQVVANNDKQRFALNLEQNKIRASQGHSIQIEPDLKVVNPPADLFHGTAEKNKASILENGITKQNRLHVHLSAEKETAIKVGSRHGKPFIFIVDTVAMLQDGYVFYLSENGVWLTDSVPSKYLKK